MWNPSLNRRGLLGGAAALALAGGAPAGGMRRVRPGQAGWPSAAEWAGLRETVGGNLVVPQALPAAGADLANPYFLGDQVGGAQVSGWLDGWRPQLSAYAAVVRSDADVTAAVNFARRHRLRLAVKGGGHSYQGTSNAADSLLIWTHRMRGIALHAGFVAEGSGAAPVAAVTAEAGALWIDLYDAVTTHAGRYVQGGGCTTVGVAGNVQSGGFGSFSKRFGMTCGNLLQADVVTADGVLRTVNAVREPELFWALKGGGGGSFGVVTRVTLRTHELPEVFGGAFGKVQAHSDAAFHRLIGQFVELYADRLCTPHWGEEVHLHPHNVLDLNMVSQGLDAGQMQADWQKLLDWIAARPAEYGFLEPFHAAAFPARLWWDVAAMRRAKVDYMRFDDRPGAPPTHGWWKGDGDQVGAFIQGFDSLWLPAALLGQRARLTDALFAASRSAAVELHFNKGLSGAPAEAVAAARDSATHPSVCDAFALAIIGAAGMPGDAAGAGRADARRVAAAMRELRQVAPQGGAYVAESDYFDLRWREHFWGPHYARLRAVKDRFDPDGLFTVHHGVGSEDWDAAGFVRTRQSA